jgi:small-conductance mechanosensitive channel
MMNADLFLGIHARTWLTAAVVLVAAIVGDLILRAWTRRRAAHTAEAPARAAAPRSFRHWVDHLVTASLGPLAFFIWIYGPYAAASLLLADAAASGTNVGWLPEALRWLRDLTTIGALCWLLARIGRVIEARLVGLATRSENAWDDIAMPLAGKALRLALPLVAIILYAPVLAVSPNLQALFSRVVSMLLIGTVAAILLQLVDTLATLVLARYRIDVSDNLQARAVYTQVTVLKKVTVAVIIVFTAASMLMVFDSVRQFGTSILASAGIAGVIVGFAAQRSIATLVAGFQIAMTQPIRIDDVVTVEGEFGRIEDITLTYVVVRLWDLRRLVVPITYFIEQPFQNWTRTSSNLLATVYLYTDYDVPIEPLRAELTRLLEASTTWDRKVNVLQVTDAKERTVEIRALASAADAGRAWDLRCEVREKLIAFLQTHYPSSLPRVRAELHDTRAPGRREGGGAP